MVAALLPLLLVRLVGAERSTLLVLLVGVLPLLLLPAYPALLVALRRRRWPLAAAAAVLVAGHVLLVLPAVTASPAAPGSPLRVVVANLYVLNPDPAAAGRVLVALQPDVVVLPELDRDGLAGLREAGLLDALPHAVTAFGPDREETVGLLSRLPLTDITTRRVGGRELPRATVEVAGTPVRLLAVHPLPPLSALTRVWRASLLDLAAEARDLQGPAVLLGDFNADREHDAFREVLAAGLRDAHDEVGRGLARTWPATLPLLHLDHVLVGERVSVAAVREVRLPGSDHRAVVADLRVSPAPPAR